MKKITSEKQIKSVLLSTANDSSVSVIAMTRLAHAGMIEFWSSGNRAILTMDGSEEKGTAAVLVGAKSLITQMINQINETRDGKLNFDPTNVQQCHEWAAIYSAMELAAGNVVLFYNERANAMRWRLSKKGLATYWQ